MATLMKRTSKVVKVATKAVRRLSIVGNNGQGFELVAIQVRMTCRDMEVPTTSFHGGGRLKTCNDTYVHIG